MGRATALYLDKRAAHVIIASRRADACKKVVVMIEEQGGEATPFAFDGTDPESCAAPRLAPRSRRGLAISAAPSSPSTVPTRLDRVA